MIASAEYVKSILARQGLKPNKDLGQNFFIRGDRLKELFASVSLQGRQVIEIGPGLGALTELLLASGAEVLAMEKDSSMVALLKEALPNPHLQVLEGDCLKQDWSALTPDTLVVGNLPYCITAAIVEKLFALGCSELVLMLQKEAADRFFAGPGAKNYGPVAVISALYYQPKLLGILDEACYYPPPTVKSATVQLIKRSDAPAAEPKKLMGFVATCLRMRRKTLHNNLSGFERGQEAMKALSLPENIRAERLTPAQFLALYTLLNEGA